LNMFPRTEGALQHLSSALSGIQKIRQFNSHV
jgi:hypothetical protein